MGYREGSLDWRFLGAESGVVFMTETTNYRRETDFSRRFPPYAPSPDARSASHAAQSLSHASCRIPYGASNASSVGGWNQ